MTASLYYSRPGFSGAADHLGASTLSIPCCDRRHNPSGFLFARGKKKRPSQAAIEFGGNSGPAPIQGQARRRSGGGDYSGRQAAGGKGMNHRSRRNGFADRAVGCASQAGNHGNACEERCGNGEDDGLAHVR